MRRFCLKAFLLIGYLTGCASAPHFDPGAMLEPLRGEEVCRSLNQARAPIASFRSLLDTTVVGPDGESVSFRYAAIGKGHDLMRIDVLPREGAYTLALITINKDEALVIDTQAKKVIEGCSPAEVLEKTLGVPGISPTTVRALIVGELPSLDCRSVKTYQANPETLLLVDREGSVAWEVASSSQELVGARLLTESGEEIVAQVDRVRTGDQISLSFKIYKPLKASAELQMVKFSINRDLADELFTVSVPAGYSREGC